MWIYTSTPPYVFMARGQLYLTFYLTFVRTNCRTVGRTDGESELTSAPQGLEFAENSSKMSSFHWSTSAQSVYRLATGWTTKGVRVRAVVGARVFFSPRRPDRPWTSQSLLSNGYRGLFSRGIKRQRREADHSPPTSAEVRKTWVYTSSPLYAFMV
jgi:hypothetical protein